MLLLRPPPRCHCPVTYLQTPCTTSRAWGATYIAAPFAIPNSRPPRCTVTRATNTTHDKSVQQPIGVVIVDHGSKRETSNAMLHEFVALYRSTTGHAIVEPAHMELASPSIADAVTNCVEQGAKHVVVAPYFLSRYVGYTRVGAHIYLRMSAHIFADECTLPCVHSGRHIQQDIPALVAEAQAQHPDVQCIIADPIGVCVDWRRVCWPGLRLLTGATVHEHVYVSMSTL